MQLRTYLIVSRAGNVRFNKTGAGVKQNEVGLRLDLNIPQEFFVRPQPVIEVNFPKEVVGTMTPEARMDVTAQTVADTLGLEVSEVKDGLLEALARKAARLELDDE